MRHQRRVVGLHVPFRKINLRFMWKTGESQRTDRAMKARHQSSRREEVGWTVSRSLPCASIPITNNQRLCKPVFEHALVLFRGAG